MTRIVWPILLIILALVALFAQLDRHSRYSPELSQWVPEPFSSFSRFHRTEAALADRDSAQASRLTLEDSHSQASALVALRPIPAEHHRLLAKTQLAIGQPDPAALTIERAARHGWRDQGVQQAMLVLAVQAEDDQQAAMRLASIWALSGDRQALKRYSASVLARPIARRHFGQILAGSRWRRNFLINGPLVLPPEVFVSTLREALRAGAQFDCKRLDRASGSLSQSANVPHDMLMAQSGC